MTDKAPGAARPEPAARAPQHTVSAAVTWRGSMPGAGRVLDLGVSRPYAEKVRIGARACVASLLATVGLISLGELAGQLLLGDPVTPQRLAALAVALLAVVAAGCVAAAVRVDRVLAAVPVVRRVTALREKSWRVAFLRLRDPGARGRPRPRAPSAAPAAA